MPTPNEQKAAVWVRLHFVANTDGSLLSGPVVGILTNETPTSYGLSSVLAQRMTDTGAETYTEGGMDFFNKAYVWHMEILPEPPHIGILEEDEFI